MNLLVLLFPFLGCMQGQQYLIPKARQGVGSFLCSRTPLIWVLVIRISLAFRANLSRLRKNYLALKFPVIGSSTVQCYGF